MTPVLQNPTIVAKAYDRIKSYIHKSPLLYSETLNRKLGNQVIFKVDATQKTGAFKVRGVLNHLLYLKEQGNLPEKVVAYSTGNHGLALAYASKVFNIKTRVYLPNNVSPVKVRIAKAYGAEVIEVPTRAQAEAMAYEDGKNGFYYLHPSDSDQTIAGSGTLTYEAIIQLKEEGLNLPEAIFASCGGGGLLSGTYLAKELITPTSKVIGCEPITANDAATSIKQGKIFRFSESPHTIADGLKTLGVSERTFNYLQRLDDFMEVSEHDIYYWTAWLFQLIKVTSEPSASISMAGAYQWLKENNIRDKTILVLISGGNIDPSFYKDLWQEEYYMKEPNLLQ